MVAVQEAVRCVLAEVLANPDLVARMRAHGPAGSATPSEAAGAQATKPGSLTRLVTRAGTRASAGWQRLRQECGRCWRCCGQALQAARRQVALLCARTAALTLPLAVAGAAEVGCCSGSAWSANR